MPVVKMQSCEVDIREIESRLVFGAFLYLNEPTKNESRNFGFLMHLKVYNLSSPPTPRHSITTTITNSTSHRHRGSTNSVTTPIYIPKLPPLQCQKNPKSHSRKKPSSSKPSNKTFELTAGTSTPSVKSNSPSAMTMAS